MFIAFFVESPYIYIYVHIHPNCATQMCSLLRVKDPMANYTYYKHVVKLGSI